MADITQTGPVGLRGLGGLSREDALIQKAAQSIPGYDMNARQISQEYTPAPVQHLGMQLAELGAGNSSYDRNITSLDQARDLNDYRFFSQSGFGQLVNGALKMGTNAITTALDGTIGSLVGIGQGIYNLFDDNPKTGFWQGMWDNDFNKAMSNIQNNMENVFPNYYSTAQQNSAWDSAANLLSANFVGDKLLKNAGFTIGMLATTLTPGINGAWVAKAVQGLGKVFTGAKATNNIMSASKIADRVAKTFIAAHSEAVTEAINAVQGEQKDVYNNLDNKLNIAKQSIQNQYAQNIKNGVAPDEAMKAYKRDMVNMTNAYKQAKEKADNDMTDIGNSTYFMNIALLSMTNNLEFSKYLKGGFNLQKGARLYQMLDKGIPVNDAEAFGKAIAHGTASLKNNIVPAASAKGVAGILAGTAGKFAEEGFEEGAQDMISDSGQLQAEAKLNQWAEQKYRQDKDRYSLFASKINPGATDEMTDRLKAMGQTWKNDFGDFSKSGWQDVFLGGLTGVLGTLGVVRKKTGHIGVGWQGGFVDQIREANDAYGQNQAKIEEVNKRLSDPVTAENARHAVAAITFANDMNQGVRDNNVKMFKNAELMSTVNDALFFKNNGLLDSYKSFYEEAAKGINDKDIAAVRSQMQELGTGKSYFDGLTDQQLKDLLQHKAASTLDRINSTLDTYEDQNLKYRQTFDKIDPAMSTSAVEQLTSLKTLYWDLNNRKDDLERQKNNADDTDDTDYDSQINSVQKSMDQVKNEYKLYTKNPQSLIDELHDVADRMQKQADGKDDKKSIENYQKASTLDDAAQVYFYNRKPETLDSAIDSAEGNNKQLLQQFKPFITQVNSLHKIVTDAVDEYAPDEQSRDNLTHAIGGIVDTAINNVLQDKDTGYDKQALIDEIKRMSDNVSDHKFVDHNGKEVEGVGHALSAILDDISYRLKTVDDIQRASIAEKNETSDEYTSEDENGISITDDNGNNVVKNEPKRINVNQKDIKDGVISDGTKIRSQLKESLPDYREEEDEGRIHIYNGYDYVGTVGNDNLFKVSGSSSDKYFNIVRPVSGKSKTVPKTQEEPVEKPVTKNLENTVPVNKPKRKPKRKTKSKNQIHEGNLFNTDEQDENDWNEAVRENTTESYQTYLDNEQEGNHRDEARKNFKNVDDSEWKKATDKNTFESYHKYIKNNPHGYYLKECLDRMKKLAPDIIKSVFPSIKMNSDGYSEVLKTITYKNHGKVDFAWHIKKVDSSTIELEVVRKSHDKNNTAYTPITTVSLPLPDELEDKDENLDILSKDSAHTTGVEKLVYVYDKRPKIDSDAIARSVVAYPDSGSVRYTFKYSLKKNNDNDIDTVNIKDATDSLNKEYKDKLNGIDLSKVLDSQQIRQLYLLINNNGVMSTRQLGNSIIDKIVKNYDGNKIIGLENGMDLIDWYYSNDNVVPDNENIQTDNNVKKVLDKVASNKLVKKLHTDKESWNRIIKDTSVIARLRKESVVYTPEENSIIERAKKNGTFMKAPNGNNTNLTQRQWVQVRTKSFKKWFGDWENDSKNASKVVDENGEPLVVYHGSPVSGFTIFKNGVHQATNGGKFASGYFFTTDLNAALRYADIHNYNKDLNGKTKEFRKRGIIDKLVGRQSKVIPNSERIREENRPVLNSEMNEGTIYDLMDKARDRGVISTNGVYACFLNIRNPKKANFKGESWANSPEKIPSVYGVQTSRQYNFDEKGRYKVENNTKNFNTLKEAQNYLDELKRNNSDKKTHTSKELGDESFEITSGGYAIREDSHFTPNKEYIRSYLIEYKIPQTINGLVDKAARDGYDGVDADNIVDANTEDNYPIHEFIPLNSNQIKSADSNIGEFDTGNPDIRKMVKSDGTVYGLVTNDGEIYLNPDNIDINTPIHEYTHLWWTIAPTETKNKIIDLLKTTDLWDSLSDNKNYSFLSTDEQKADEIFARYTAVRGENNIDKLLNNNDKGKIRNAINTLFNWLKSSFSKLFGISNSLDNFSDMTLRQLFEDETTVVPDNGNVQTENNVSTVENTKELPLPNSSYRSNAFQQYEDDISKEGSKNKGTARERKAESAKKFREFLKNENIDIDHITNYRLHDLMKNGKLSVSYMTIDGRPDDIFLTIPYTSDVEKIVPRSEGRGNIVKTNEGESLIVGVQGFFYTKGNQSLLDGHNILKQKIADERKQNAYKGKYYVSSMGNQIYDVSPGSAVRQYENEERNDSNVKDLLQNKNSNPYGLKANDLVWGVAEGNTDEGTVNMKYINADGKQVVSPDNPSPGKVYLYVPASDGTYIPMYITPKVYNDDFDHTEINKLVRGIVNAPDVKARKTEINKLRDILMFSYGNNIYYDDETNKLNYRKGNLREDKEIDFGNGNKEQQITDLDGILKDLNPRINLSTSVLSTNPEFYLKSGLVNTGTRVLGTVNAQGYLYPVDKNGNPITSFKSRSEANNMVVKTIAARPVWVNGEKFLYNGELYTDTNGNPLDDKKTMYVKDIRGIMTGQGKTVNISNYDYHEINGRVYIMTKGGEYQQLTGSMLNKYESLRKEWQAEKDRKLNRENKEPVIKTDTSDIIDNAPEEVREFADKNKGKILYSSDLDLTNNDDRKALYNEVRNYDGVTSRGNTLFYHGEQVADIGNDGEVTLKNSILSKIAMPINYGNHLFIMRPERSDEVTDIPPKGYDDYVNGLMADEKKNNEKPVSTTSINGVDTKIAKNDKENSDNRANISNFENTYKKYGNKAALKEVIQQLTGKKVKNAKEVKEILLGSNKEVAGLASNVKTSADIDKIIEALKDCGI